VKIDTVDSFEGREEDIVVISLVRSNERGRIGFLRVPNRLNVAISRAKHLVACIGDSATLRSGEESMYGQLVEAARSTGGWLSALELVQPPARRRGGGRRADGEEADEAAEPGAEPGRRRRRRRRRGRRGGAADVAAGGEQQPAAAAASPNGEVASRADGPSRRRRRRRRRRGQGRSDTPAGAPAEAGLTETSAVERGPVDGANGSAPEGAPAPEGRPASETAPRPVPIVLPGEVISGTAVVPPSPAEPVDD
jgi:hypothetical protein